VHASGVEKLDEVRVMCLDLARADAEQLKDVEAIYRRAGEFIFVEPEDFHGVEEFRDLGVHGKVR